MENELRETIRRTRRERNLTLQQVAELAGITNPVVSWSETGNRPVSRKATERILAALGLDPAQHIHLWQPHSTTKRANAAQTSQPQAENNDRPPYVQRTLSKEEQVTRLEKQLERFLATWARMAGAAKLPDGSWNIPHDAKKPELIAQEATATETYASDFYDPDNALIELRQGLLIVHTNAYGEGRCNITLARQDRVTEKLPQWRMEPEPHQDGFISYHPVTHAEVEDAIPPGQYRLEVTADCKWDFTWSQPGQGTGFVDLIEDPDTRRLEWKTPGTFYGGPTAPTDHQLTLHAVQKDDARLTLHAYPIDASDAEVTIIDRRVGPEPVTTHSPLDPSKEYFIHITADAAWDLFFTDDNKP